MLKEEEWARMEAAYEELMRKITAHKRQEEIWSKGFDKTNARKLREKLGLPSFQQVVEKKRLSFAASVLTRNEGKKVYRVMGEDEQEAGEWWKQLEKDMQKYGIESKKQLEDLGKNKLLEMCLREKVREQDKAQKQEEENDQN